MIIGSFKTNWQFEPRFPMRIILRVRLTLGGVKHGNAHKTLVSKGHDAGAGARAHACSFWLPGARYGRRSGLAARARSGWHSPHPLSTTNRRLEAIQANKRPDGDFFDSERWTAARRRGGVADGHRYRH